jgi:predicted RNase H-like nuclease (RuvC/YqgF family)
VTGWRGRLRKIAEAAGLERQDELASDLNVKRDECEKNADMLAMTFKKGKELEEDVELFDAENEKLRSRNEQLSREIEEFQALMNQDYEADCQEYGGFEE